MRCLGARHPRGRQHRQLRQNPPIGQSMAAGCAMVASNTPPVQEIIQHKTKGLLVDFFDSQQLAHTAQHVIAEQNSTAIQAMRAQARQTVLAHCDPQTFTAQWKEILL